MFETSREMQLNGLPIASPRKFQQWHSVTQTLLIRWFQIRYLCTDPLTEKVLMTGDLEVLASINADPSFHVLNVNLASPPNINGTDNWAFSRLTKVTTLISRSPNWEKLVGYEYHIEGGMIIFEAFDSSEENGKIERVELLIRGDSAPEITPGLIAQSR